MIVWGGYNEHRRPVQVGDTARNLVATPTDSYADTEPRLLHAPGDAHQRQGRVLLPRRGPSP